MAWARCFGRRRNRRFKLRMESPLNDLVQRYRTRYTGGSWLARVSHDLVRWLPPLASMSHVSMSHVSTSAATSSGELKGQGVPKASRRWLAAPSWCDMRICSQPHPGTRDGYAYAEAGALFKPWRGSNSAIISSTPGRMHRPGAGNCRVGHSELWRAQTR